MVHSAGRVSHLGERVHRPRPHEWTARRWVRRFRFRNRREVSADSAQLLEEEDWSQGGGRSHTQSAPPSAPESVGYHRRSNFEFQRPGRRACARGGRGRAGRACPRPRSWSRDAPKLWLGWSCEPALSSARVETLLPLNCLGRAPCGHARTHACPSGPFPLALI